MARLPYPTENNPADESSMFGSHTHTRSGWSHPEVRATPPLQRHGVRRPPRESIFKKVNINWDPGHLMRSGLERVASAHQSAAACADHKEAFTKVTETGLEKSFLCQSQNFSGRARVPFFWSHFLSSWSQSCAKTQKFRRKKKEAVGGQLLHTPEHEHHQ